MIKNIKTIIHAIKMLLRKCWLETMDSDAYCQYLKKRGVKIGSGVHFRYPSHTLIDTTRPSLVEFGNNIDINDYFTVLTHDFGSYVLRGKYHDFMNSSGQVKIGNNVVIGRNVTILKGVTIGDNTIIALGSVVTKTTPPNSVVAGVPARVISSLDNYYKKRKSLQVNEALEYAASIIQRMGRQPAIDDFTEEWSLFITPEEYRKYPALRKNVDFRLKEYVDIEEYLSQPRAFNGFDGFMGSVHEYIKQSTQQ